MERHQEAPTPAGPAISTKDVGRIFFSGNKAQRKRAMPEKNDAVRGLRAPWIKSCLGIKKAGPKAGKGETHEESRGTRTIWGSEQMTASRR